MRAAPVLVPVAIVFTIVAALTLRTLELRNGVSVHQSPRPVAVQGSVELIRADARVGETVVFEACSLTLLEAVPPPLRFEIVPPGSATVAQPLDAAAIAAVHRGTRYGCLVIARVPELRTGGTHVLRAVGNADEPFVGRILTRSPIGRREQGLAFGLLLASFVSLLGLVRVFGAREATESARPPLVTALAAIVILAAGFGVSMSLPLAGSTGGLARGLVLVVAQLAAFAFALRSGLPAASLGLALPRYAPAALLGAAVLGVVVRLLEVQLVQWFGSQTPSAVAQIVLPSLARDHVETVLDSFDGVIAVVTVALIAPAVEELFFRGALYGALERWKGPPVAFVGVVVAFLVAHLPQVGGQPAAIAGLTLLAAVTTGLRLWSGSVVVPFALHATHNLIIAWIALAMRG